MKSANDKQKVNYRMAQISISKEPSDRLALEGDLRRILAWGCTCSYKAGSIGRFILQKLSFQFWELSFQYVFSISFIGICSHVSFLLLLTCCPALLETKIKPDCRLLTHNHEALIPDYTILSEVEKTQEVYKMAKIGPARSRYDLRYNNFDDNSMSSDSESNMSASMSSGDSDTVDSDFGFSDDDSVQENTPQSELNVSMNTYYSFSSDSCPPELNSSSDTIYSFSSNSSLNSKVNVSADSIDEPCLYNSDKSIFLNDSVESHSSVNEIIDEENCLNETIDLEMSKDIIVIDESSENESGEEVDIIIPKTPIQFKRTKIFASPRVLKALKHRQVS